MKNKYTKIDELLKNYPTLQGMNLSEPLHTAADLMTVSFQHKGKLLVCGNGGSAADADHIVSELMKNFICRRPVNPDLYQQLTSSGDNRAAEIAANLQGSLPAINLSAHTALLTAFTNDADGQYVFAQQVSGYGQPGDVLLAISTSGNSVNVLNAAVLAKHMDIRVIGLTGSADCMLSDYCDVCIAVPAGSTPEIQELHLPIYHALCAEVERRVWNVR